MWTHFFSLGGLFRLCHISDIAENIVNIFIRFQKVSQCRVLILVVTNISDYNIKSILLLNY